MKKYIDSDSMSETYAGRIDAAPSESLYYITLMVGLVKMNTTIQLTKGNKAYRHTVYMFQWTKVSSI